jgi:hypothetical protein
MKGVTRIVGLLALVAGFMWLVWEWGFCRFYVKSDQMAIVTAKVGKPLDPGQILARRGQQGVQDDVLGEGRHFLNPILYDHEIVPVTIVPLKKVGVVTSKVGADLPQGEFLAEPGQKGIWRRVLGPGKYRLNPVGYKIDVVDAVSIPIGYAGVVTSLSGRQAPEGQFAAAGEKGVWKDILQPGLYYINPREFKVDVLEIGVTQVSLLGKTGGQVITKGPIATQTQALNELQRNQLLQQQLKRQDYMLQAAPAQTEGRKGAPTSRHARAVSDDGSTFVLDQFVEFPSRDGFEISLDMTVEFELLPASISWIFRSYGDLPAATDKVIMPQILSLSRLKGSAYGARDFIVGEGREKFQNDLTEALSKTLAERKILIHSILIRHVNVPMQILDPIQQASVAVEQDLTNKEKQNTARRQAELNTELSLIEQKREQVAQETEKIKAEILADQEKKVAETHATTLKLVAEIEQQTAGVRAEKTTTLGKAEADTVRLVEGEKAKGFQLKTQAFGDPMAYNLWTFANTLNDKLNVTILHAGPGTLWTDLERAALGDVGGAKILQQKAESERK